MAKSGGDDKKRGRGKAESERQAMLIGALNHQLRRRILRVLHAGDEPRSPVQLAKELEEPLSTVSYHVTVLIGFCALEPAGERQVRGTVEHFYASTVAAEANLTAMLEATAEADTVS
jgi:DNA-binding transcriptional ArsR family regulator